MILSLQTVTQLGLSRGFLWYIPCAAMTDNRHSPAETVQPKRGVSNPIFFRAIPNRILLRFASNLLTPG